MVWENNSKTKTSYVVSFISCPCWRWASLFNTVISAKQIICPLKMCVWITLTQLTRINHLIRILTLMIIKKFFDIWFSVELKTLVRVKKPRVSWTSICENFLQAEKFQNCISMVLRSVHNIVNIYIPTRKSNWSSNSILCNFNILHLFHKIRTSN